MQKQETAIWKLQKLKEEVMGVGVALVSETIGK
jgi:hypothetical protein